MESSNETTWAPLEGNNRFDDDGDDDDGDGNDGDDDDDGDCDGDDDVDNGDDDDGDDDEDEIDNVETRAFICYNVVASLRIQSCRRGSTS